MAYNMKPLACDLARIKGMSERLIISHYENNYGGAVKRLSLIGEKLAELDYANAPGFLINGLKREELVAMNSMVLHEHFFDSLGDASEPDPVLHDALMRDFGSVERWRSEFIAMGKALRRRLRLGAAIVVAARPQTRQSMGLRPLPHAGWRRAHSRARHARTFLSHRFRRQSCGLRWRLHGRHQLAGSATRV
jgi:hypothetical protein